MPNTGYIGCLLLEQYYLDTNLPTGVVVPNDPSHPAYIPPTFNPSLCPVGTPLPTITPTPSPTPIPIPMLGGLRFNNGGGNQVVNLPSNNAFRFTQFPNYFSLFVEFTPKAELPPISSILISALTTSELTGINSGWWIELNSGELSFNITGIASVSYDLGSYATNVQDERMNMGVVYSPDNELLNLYFNGVLVDSVSISGIFTIPTGDVQLGGDIVNAESVADYQLFDGILWNVFFYGVPLLAQDILALSSGLETGISFAKYYLNDEEGLIAIDNSGNLFSGSLIGYSTPEVSYGPSNNWVNENETSKT